MKRALSSLYRGISTLRNSLYDRGFLSVSSSILPTICVGNIAAGGSGKTPLVQSVVNTTVAEGFKPVILLRGYGGSVSGPMQVSEQHTSAQVGDEAVLHYRSAVAPVVVARDRVLGVRLIEREQLGNVVILDDGLQHRRLARDLNIITIDVRNEEVLKDFLSDHVLPMGLLREPRAEGLRRGHMYVLNHRGPRTSVEHLEAVYNALPQGVPTVEAWMSADRVVKLGKELQSPQKVVAVSGIARPSGFYVLLEEMGFEIMARHAFSDHRPFDETVIRGLRRRFPELPFVCTPKDIARMSRDEAKKWWSPELKTELDQPDVLRRSIRELLHP